MKKNQGFTLIELLAVIVILAIILIIAVPGVLSIIKKTKDNAYDRQLDIIKEASRLYVTSDSDVIWTGENPKTTNVSLDTLKEKGYLDQKIINPRTKKEIVCAKTSITKTGSKYDYTITFCDQVNNNPRVSSDMIPIRYDGAAWVKADYTNKDNNRYDYDNQQWANIATVTEATRDKYKKANIGSEVKMEDINTMFVWIPRFKYKLFNVDGTTSPVGNPNMAGDYTIDVQLEETSTPKSTGTQNGEWLTHPAFTFGGEELEGFWVAKFETGYDGASTIEDAQSNTVNPFKVRIKPNIYSWRSIQLMNMYKNATGLKQDNNPFGFTSIEDPHMMKNMEWGALAYLTNSKYGKQGNDAYVGTEKQVRSNNNRNAITGCGAETQDATAIETCNSYETANGQTASTTGNISGVYDTAGGSWEYVAGVMKNTNGIDLIASQSGFDQGDLNQLGQNNKYLDIYNYSTDPHDRTRSHLGDATLEMGPFNGDRSAWYDDLGRFVFSDQSWFFRGGYWESTPSAIGSPAFSIWYGSGSSNITSRIVIL